jgi:hypothetical protein
MALTAVQPLRARATTSRYTSKYALGSGRVTTIKVETDVRDALARVATDDLGSVTLNAALAHLLTEHRKAAILAAYARLEVDPSAWSEYESELAEWDGATGDGSATGR